MGDINQITSKKKSNAATQEYVKYTTRLTSSVPDIKIIFLENTFPIIVPGSAVISGESNNVIMEFRSRNFTCVDRSVLRSRRFFFYLRVLKCSNFRPSMKWSGFTLSKKYLLAIRNKSNWSYDVYKYHKIIQPQENVFSWFLKKIIIDKKKLN